ncbi:MAG: RNA-binding protein, partial [Patescibacteria group bacterium]|nr:RNA-binding protein [Patescibacteria group bacterium]
MASKTLFRSMIGQLLPKTNTHNEEGRPAYAFSAQHALAQFAATGCLNSTFYASAEEQLDRILTLCAEVEPEFIARAALYARQKGFMKDLPALLCAVLAVRSPGLLAEVFDRVIDSPKMLRNFVQIVRSGVVGRKSLGTLPKRLILQWLEHRSDEQLFTASVGNDPSLADIVKMVHPKPAGASRQALYGYLLGRQHDAAALPDMVREYEAFKRADGKSRDSVPNVPFQMLTSLPMGKAEWAEIARNAPWQMTRMNLNTFARHGVFESAEMVDLVARRLRSPELVADARVLPYQLMVAYATATDVPAAIRNALQDAMEIAIRNVPRIEGKV